nr:MAG TPA: hypothetical protein [Caudoviricetes sp.]
MIKAVRNLKRSFKVLQSEVHRADNCQLYTQ